MSTPTGPATSRNQRRRIVRRLTDRPGYTGMVDGSPRIGGELEHPLLGRALWDLWGGSCEARIEFNGRSRTITITADSLSARATLATEIGDASPSLEHHQLTVLGTEEEEVSDIPRSGSSTTYTGDALPALGFDSSFERRLAAHSALLAALTESTLGGMRFHSLVWGEWSAACATWELTDRPGYGLSFYWDSGDGFFRFVVEDLADLAGPDARAVHHDVVDLTQITRGLASDLIARMEVAGKYAMGTEFSEETALQAMRTLG